jgi:hypothetical protein
VKARTFDCVEMKRRGAEHVYSIIKDMTPDQELEYWRERTKEMRQEQSAIRAKAKPHAPSQTDP